MICSLIPLQSYDTFKFWSIELSGNIFLILVYTEVTPNDWVNSKTELDREWLQLYYYYRVLCFIFDRNFLWYCFVDFLCCLIFCSYYCMLINQSVLFLLDTQHRINIVIKFIRTFDVSFQTIGIKKIEKTQNLHGVLFTVHWWTTDRRDTDTCIDYKIKRTINKINNYKSKFLYKQVFKN